MPSPHLRDVSDPANQELYDGAYSAGHQDAVNRYLPALSILWWAVSSRDQDRIVAAMVKAREALDG